MKARSLEKEGFHRLYNMLLNLTIISKVGDDLDIAHVGSVNGQMPYRFDRTVYILYPSKEDPCMGNLQIQKPLLSLKGNFSTL